jgi:O-antigen ligase
MTAAVRSLAVLLILLAPFGEGGRRPDALAALHALATALLLLAAIETLSRPGAGRPRGRGIGVLLLPATAFALACLSAARAAFPYAAWLGLMDRLAVLGAFLGAAFLLRRPADLILLRGAVVIATTIQALMALAEFARGGPTAAASLFLNPNHLAAYLGLGLFLCVTAAAGDLGRGRRRAAALWSAAGSAHLVAFLLLQSRGALLGLLAGGGLLLVRTWGRMKPAARAASALALAIVVALGAYFVYLRFARSDDPDRYTRLSIWEAGLGMVRERPLLGFGPGSLPHEASRHNFPRLVDPVRFGRSFKGAHGALLTHAAEDGAPAAALVLVGLVAAVVLLYRRPGEGRCADAVLGTALLTTALLAQGLVEDLQARPALTLTAALLLGSALASSRAWRPESRPARRRMIVTASLIASTLYLAVSGIARPFLGWRAAEEARAAGRAGLPAMQRAAALDPWNPEYHHDLAMAALNSAPPGPGPYVESMLQLEAAQRRRPFDPRFPLLMARLEARGGRRIFDDPSRDEAAAALYAEAARLAPTDPRPHLEQAAHLASLGREEEALRVLDGALLIEPNYRRARILKVSLLRGLGRTGEAEAAYASLLATDRALIAYKPDSGYASEIAAEGDLERAALEAALAGRPDPAGSATTH